MSQIKTVVFLSNFFNHHQKPLSEALFLELGDGYTFIETEEMTEERKNMGYSDKNKPSYVKYYTDPECFRLIDQADVVIWGSAPVNLIYNRRRSKKLIFRYSERLFKRKVTIWNFPRFLYNFCRIPRLNKNTYLLCASAYAAADYAKLFAFVDRAYKWGYFPETKRYEDLDSLIESKDVRKILWCGRFLELKHPEMVVEVACRLKAEGYDFQVDMIGIGELEGQLQAMIAEKDLSNEVHLLGSMSPEEVRSHMEKASIYLFTSDRNEGWGAVLNESMNSACAVVASHAIGSVPYLIENEKNGLIYRDGDLDDLYQKVKYLLDHPDRRVELSQNAYTTIVDEWNAENAAKKLLKLAEQLMSSSEVVFECQNKICSKAEFLRDNWYVDQKNKMR